MLYRSPTRSSSTRRDSHVRITPSWRSPALARTPIIDSGWPICNGRASTHGARRSRSSSHRWPGGRTSWGSPRSALTTRVKDVAGLELAQRKAIQHREMAFQNRDSLLHTATGDPPGESVPPRPTVFVRERRNPDNSMVLLTLIDIGGAATLRHVQRIESTQD